MALSVFEIQVHQMIYKVREIQENDVWVAAYHNDMLFARNERDEYFTLTGWEQTDFVRLLSARKNIILTWNDKPDQWIRKRYNITIPMIRMSGLCRNISYDLACVRAGILRIHTPHKDNELALAALNLMTMYKTFLKNECKMLLSLTAEFQQNFLQCSSTEVIEKLKVIQPSYSRPCQQFRYQPPEQLKFTEPFLNDLLNDILSHDFYTENGKIKHPKLPQTFVYDGTEITVGIGGIHGFNPKINRVSTADEVLLDWDVGSYYPSQICKDKVLGRILGKNFVSVYNGIREKRLAVKKSDPVLANGLKLILNSATGRLQDAKSRLYNPQAYIQITLTGQLYLLMIANMCHDAGIPFYSLNTDGITLLDNAEHSSRRIFDHMTELTGFTFDDTVYEKYYARDVNNYFAVKEHGIKGKGIFGFSRSMTRQCNNLAVNYMIKRKVMNNIEPKESIKEIPLCDFLDTANSNATNELFRFYRSVSSADCIRNKNGRKIPCSDHCRALSINETDFSGFESDIDYEWYKEQAGLMLNKILPAFVV
jgi:hypothetical protein